MKSEEKVQEFFEGLVPQIKEISLNVFGRAHIFRKGDDVNDVVTEADTKIQEVIMAELLEKFPEDGIVSEELAQPHPGTSGRTWYIDPLDGTRNFASGVPVFGTLVGLATSDRVLSAMNYLPISDELYVAHAGMGAFKNGLRVVCSAETDFARSYGCGPVKIGGSGIQEELAAAISEIVPGGVWANSVGSVAVAAAYASDGRRDWYFSKGANSWDYTAPALIGKESGALVVNFEGAPWKPGDLSLVIASPGLESEVRKIIELMAHR